MKHLLQLIEKLSNFYNIKISAQPTTTGWVNITINDYSVELPLPDDEEKTVDTLFRFNVLDEIFPEKSFEELVAKSLVPNPCFKLDDYEGTSVYIDFINKKINVVMDGFLYTSSWTKKHKLKEQIDLIQSSGMVDGKEIR